MPDEIYEVVAQGARYWFLFLMALIVWRSWRWYRKDKRQAKKRLKLLPDAGYVGEMVVIQGGKGLERGEVLPVPREGTLGQSRLNDLCVPLPGVSKKHLWFRYDDGKGLMVEPFSKNEVLVDGAAFESRREPLYMAHGSRLYAGTAELRLRLFAGFEATGHAVRMPEQQPLQPQPTAEEMQQQAYQQWMQQQWMMQQYARQAYEQGYQQAMAQQQPQQPPYVQPMAELPEDPVSLADDVADVYSYEAAREMGMVDHSAFMRPVGQSRPELPVYEQPPAVEEAEETFEMPVMEDGAWEEDAFDEDMTDAAAPPKSAYVGHDEAEHAKRKVWDKYFGGGQR